MSEWKPIESAPSATESDDYVLVYSPQRGIGMQMADGVWWRQHTNRYTHWMPLPAPPAEDA